MLLYIQSTGEYSEDDEGILCLPESSRSSSNPLIRMALKFAGGAFARALIVIARLV
jgi:hypothetical protein